MIVLLLTLTRELVMANNHFGNLADVFKHLALAEALGAMRPAEYWESHAGNAIYDENADFPPERLHGIHTFHRRSVASDTLRQSAYAGILGTPEVPLARIPGSPLLARRILGNNVRRLLLCDTDAESLVNIRSVLLPAVAGLGAITTDTLECVQDDGITVLRGAGMLIPEPWTASTLAFIDPYDMAAVSAADISPLELACELASRGIATLLFYTFADDACRAGLHERIHQALAKARLLARGPQRFEGALKIPASPEVPTQWGFGLLALNLSGVAVAGVEHKLAALEALYQSSEIQTRSGPVCGAWRYTRVTL